MDAPLESAERDRRRAPRDRRRRLRDRRHFWPRFVPAGGMGRVLCGLTGPWSSANGISWLRLFILFFIVRWGVVTVYSIPSASMEPTLHGKASFIRRDRVAVNKLAFGPRVPFTAQRVFSTGTPRRWDIVAFNSPRQADDGEVLIKRVAGLPGDIVQIKSGGLYINNVLVEPPAALHGKLNYTAGLEAKDDVVNRLALTWAKSGLIPAAIVENPSPDLVQLQRDLEKLREELRNVDVKKVAPKQAAKLTSRMNPLGMGIIKAWWERQFLTRAPALWGVSTALETTLVPEEHYFLLGDNGPESSDSRIFGWVPHENLIGRAFAIVTPFARARDLSGFLDTLRGRLIFYGTLALAAAWEIIPGFIVFSWKLRGTIPSLGLHRGDRVLVDRIEYGLRIPLTNRRLVWWRAPKPGEVVCFFMSRSGSAFDLYFGEVLSVERERGLRILVRGPDEEGSRHFLLSRGDVVGRALAVWRPWGRRGRVRAAARVESAGGDRLH